MKPLAPLAVVVFAALATTGCGRIAARREAARIPVVTALVTATTSTFASSSSDPLSVETPIAVETPPTVSTATPTTRPSAAPSVQTAAPYPVGSTKVSFDFDGHPRTFTVYIPADLPTGRAVPLVFQLHGGGGTGVDTDSVTRLNAVADREGFIVVAPDGVEKNWNDGRVDVRDKTAFVKNIDDVGFLVTVLDEIGTHHRVDQRRVYAMGISNGAMMSGRLACERPDRFAAVGLVAGTGPIDLANSCGSKGSASIIAFNGTDDPLISYAGDASVHPELGKRLSVDQLAEYWTTRNGCTDPPTTDQVTPTISRRTWSCGSTAVVFHRVNGAGHTWPGGRQYLPKLIIGSTDGSMDATTVMWEFFTSHPRP